MDQYVALPAFGQAPSHPVMYNPDLLDMQSRTAVLNALMSLNNMMYLENYSMRGTIYTGCYDITVHQIDESSDRNQCGDEILSNVLNTQGLTRVNTQEHLGSYSTLIVNIPGISNYGEKFRYQLLSTLTEVGGGQAASSLPQVGPPSTPNIVLGALNS